MRKNYNFHIKNKSDITNNSNKKESKENKKINFKTIYELYKTHYIDNCELILLEKQNNFLDKFFNTMKAIIKSEYGEDIYDKNNILCEITKKCENDFISDIYWPMYDSCINGYEKYKTSRNNNSFYLSNFKSHCNFEQIAIHSCGSKFIQINSSQSQKLYALCTGCKKCYYNTYIPLYCPFSHKKYFSKIKNEEEDNSLVPATWEEYHCKNPIINEQMTCIQCRDKFWIKNDKLFCKNCKLEIDPLLIIWTCTTCKKDFKSKAKMYNPLENEEIEKSIKEARLLKKIAKPNEIPCKCIKNSDIKKYNFYHHSNGQCKGVLYYGKLKDEDILVCSICNSFFPINTFNWICPVCGKKFLTNNINKDIKRDNFNRHSINTSKNEKNRIITNSISSVNLSDNSENNLIYNYKGTPIRELNSYVKKKPNDYYYSNRNKESNLTNKKRNLSIIFTNKMINNNNNFDNENLNNELNINNENEKENKYNTNTNFYYSKNKMDFTKSTNRETNDNSNYINKNLIIHNDFLSPTQKDEITSEKKYTKFQLSKNPSKRFGINESKRYGSTSTRSNIHHNEVNGDISMADYNKDKNNHMINSYQQKFQKYSHFNRIINIKHNITNNNDNHNDNDNDFMNSKIYIPKRKLDLNTSNNIITSPRDNTGNTNKKNASNSVGIRERYKRINKQINNLYEKRNLKTMFDNDNNTPENFKEIRSSSQYRIERDKNRNLNLDINNNINKISLNDEDSSVKNKVNENFNNLKHKYNKRNIENKNNINYYSNLNIQKRTSKNIYTKSINNNIPNKEKTGTNISNGGDNIVVNNNITNNNNLDKIYNKKTNEDNIRSSRIENKKYMNKNKDKEIKYLKEKKYTSNNINLSNNNKKDKINNNNIKRSWRNGGNSVKEFDNDKNYKTTKNENLNSSQNNELKEFNVNDYKVITQLGQGTFGKIYLVQDKKNELFSMKKIILSEELDVQSVINEYKMCQKLKHSNVVKILGIYNNKLDITTYVVYVLMEVGLTDWEKEIRSYNDKNLEYTEKELIQIIKQLSSVLSFLQKNNISHRDIKPQNILVFKNNIYKVADFGEAKQIDNIVKNLINYSLRGTELYMSPLLFNGLRTGQIDIKHNLFKSDVYSLGLCILYAAVTNNKPLYEIRKYVEMGGVKKYLEKLLRGKYSQKFLSLLGSMLEIHEKNRPDFIELEKIMKKWK